MKRLSFSSILYPGLGAFNISILSTFWILWSGFIFPSINNSSTNCLFNGCFSWGNILIFSLSSITYICCFGDFNISILSTFCISFSDLSIPSINNISATWHFKGFLSIGEINKSSVDSIILGTLGFFNIVINDTFCISLFDFANPSIHIESIICPFNNGFSLFWIISNPSTKSTTKFLWIGKIFIPSMYKSSVICFFKGSFSLGNICKFSFSSIMLSGLGISNNDNLSIFWILFSGIINFIDSIYKSSTNCFFKGSFSIGNISKLSFISILFWGLGVLNMDNLSVFCILFSGFILVNCSIYKSSTNCFCNGSFSFGNISKLSFASIIFWGLGVLNMDNLSVFCILFSGFILENCSIYKSSTNCFCNGSFSFGNIIMLSFASILFWGLGFLNMDNWSVFWILFSDFIWFNPSINNASIICFFKGSFSKGNISKFSFASIILSGLGVLNIDNLSIFWILFSGFNKVYLSIYKSSTNCFFKIFFSFLTGIISILSLISILFWGFGVLNIDILSIFCILFSDFNNINPSIYNESINCFFKGSFSLGKISKFSLASINNFSGINLM